MRKLLPPHLSKGDSDMRKFLFELSVDIFLTSDGLAYGIIDI